jgi:competence protein ComFC
MFFQPQISNLLRSAVGESFSTLAGLLCPPECAQCGADLETGGYLCAECMAQALPVEAPFCDTCSEPFEGSVIGPFTCCRCQTRRFAFDCAVSRCRFRGVVRDLILRFKYGRQRYLRRPLACWLAETLEDERIRQFPANALVPVPLHPRRQRERGFNQSRELCDLLARQTGLPVWTALRRARYTEPQARLERAARLDNLRGAFDCRPRWPVEGAFLLLVDDVFTTGSTVDECARVLLDAGASGVRVITVARG